MCARFEGAELLVCVIVDADFVGSQFCPRVRAPLECPVVERVRSVRDSAILRRDTTCRAARAGLCGCTSRLSPAVKLTATTGHARSRNSGRTRSSTTGPPAPVESNRNQTDDSARARHCFSSTKNCHRSADSSSIDRPETAAPGSSACELGEVLCNRREGRSQRVALHMTRDVVRLEFGFVNVHGAMAKCVIISALYRCARSAAARVSQT